MKKWFDMILSGEKKEEYREFKEYWIKRFGYKYEGSNNPDDNGYWCEEMENLPDAIRFTNGYSRNAPSFLIECKGWKLGKSKHPEWGGDTQKDQFIFKLGDLLNSEQKPKRSVARNDDSSNTDD